MNSGEVIFGALQDAIGWQNTLADAHKNCDDGIREEALAMVERYRKLLVKLFGTDRTELDRMLDEAKPVTLADLRRMAKTDL